MQITSCNQHILLVPNIAMDNVLKQDCHTEGIGGGGGGETIGYNDKLGGQWFYATSVHKVQLSSIVFILHSKKKLPTYFSNIL